MDRQQELPGGLTQNEILGKLEPAWVPSSLRPTHCPLTLMRGQKTGRRTTVARRTQNSALARADSQQAEELMDLAVDAARSRHLPDFLRRFSQRAAAMAGADWVGVVVLEGEEADLYSSVPLDPVKGDPDRAWLVSNAREVSRDAQVSIL